MEKNNLFSLETRHFWVLQLQVASFKKVSSKWKDSGKIDFFEHWSATLCLSFINSFNTGSL